MASAPRARSVHHVNEAARTVFEAMADAGDPER
jgi:hypothetical protein